MPHKSSDVGRHHAIEIGGTAHDANVSEFRLRPVVRQVLENQQLTLVSQRLRLDVHIEDLTLAADRGKIRLILENLLSNAIKYSPRGGVINLRARAVGAQLVLDVADSGPGVPPEDPRPFASGQSTEPRGRWPTCRRLRKRGRAS